MKTFNKILLASSLIVGFSAVTHAKVEPFIGVGAAASTSQLNVLTPELAATEEVTIKAMRTFQLRGGAVINDAHRLSATLGRTAAKDNFEHSFGLLSYDYLIPVSSSGNAKVFVGGSVGQMHAELKDRAVPYADDISEKGYVYGLQTGLNYKMSKNFSTEVGYRYLKHESNNTLDLDATGQLYLSVDYTF